MPTTHKKKVSANYALSKNKKKVLQQSISGQGVVSGPTSIGRNLMRIVMLNNTSCSMIFSIISTVRISTGACILIEPIPESFS
jgi:hypothetical protein